MTRADLSVREMSPLTQSLLKWERPYAQKEVRVQTALAGRVVFAAVSFLAHAEAVMRVAYLCFLAIKALFSPTGVIQFQRQKKECAAAYELSLRSLIACLDRSVLSQTAERTVSELYPAPIADRQGELAARPPTPEIQVEGVPAPEAEPGELVQPVPGNVIAMSPVQRADSPASVQEEIERGVAATPDPEEEKEPEPPVRAPVFTAVLPPPYPRPVPAVRLAVEPPPVVIQDVGPEQLPVDMPRLVSPPQPQGDKGHRVYMDADQLYREWAATLADARFSVNCEETQALAWRTDLVSMRSDRRCFVDSPLVFPPETGTVGQCLFSSEGNREKSCQLAYGFSLQRGHEEVPIQLFGLFEAVGGLEAARFVKDKFQPTLSKMLEKHAQKTFDELAVANALESTFHQLDGEFKATYKHHADLVSREYIGKQGTKATVAVLIGGHLFVAQLGSGRAILSTDTKETVQLTVPVEGGVGFYSRNEAMSHSPKLSHKEVRSPCTLVLGTASCFERCSTEELGSFLVDIRKPPKDLAFEFVMSAWKHRQDSPSFDFGCLVVQLDNTPPANPAFSPSGTRFHYDMLSDASPTLSPLAQPVSEDSDFDPNELDRISGIMANDPHDQTPLTGPASEPKSEMSDGVAVSEVNPDVLSNVSEEKDPLAGLAPAAKDLSALDFARFSGESQGALHSPARSSGVLMDADLDVHSLGSAPEFVPPADAQPTPPMSPIRAEEPPSPPNARVAAAPQPAQPTSGWNLLSKTFWRS